MKRQFWQIIVLMLLLIVFLCSCDSEPKQIAEETVMPTDTIIETTELEIELDPNWISENAIDEVYACLFPLEGEKNIELAQEILLPLVEAGNAEAQYYWAYIYDWEIVDNSGKEEKESLYWHNLAIEQGFAKSCLAASLNTYVESEERAEELVEMAKQAGLFEMAPEELGADGCQLLGSYYYSKTDYKSAFQWFAKGADKGSAVAMNYIGLMYYAGEGVTKDITKSLEWITQAIDLGSTYAMNDYAVMLTKEDVCENLLKRGIYHSQEKIKNRANHFLNESADAGNAVAMVNLGYQYYVNGNDNAAMRWFEKAAKEGNAVAMWWTGALKTGNNRSVENIVNDGMAWCMKAYANGQDGAIEYINTLLKEKCGVNAYFENYGELISIKP